MGVRLCSVGVSGHVTELTPRGERGHQGLILSAVRDTGLSHRSYYLLSPRIQWPLHVCVHVCIKGKKVNSRISGSRFDIRSQFLENLKSRNGLKFAKSSLIKLATIVFSMLKITRGLKILRNWPLHSKNKPKLTSLIAMATIVFSIPRIASELINSLIFGLYIDIEAQSWEKT